MYLGECELQCNVCLMVLRYITRTTMVEYIELMIRSCGGLYMVLRYVTRFRLQLSLLEFQDL